MFLNLLIVMILSLGSSDWDREEFTWLSDGSTSGVQEPTLTFYMGDVNGTTNGNTFDAPLSELSDNYGFQNLQYFL